MLDVRVIGIGNCGNQIALKAHKEANCEVFAINSSENDLSTLPDTIPKSVIGDMEGTGKKRSAAKQFLKECIMELIRGEKFISFMDGADVILIVSSTGGGTGSGIAPMLSQIISTTFLQRNGEPIVPIIIGVMPRLTEGYSTQVNTMEYMNELLSVLDQPVYDIYDNNNFAKESAYKNLTMVNSEIVDHIKIMQCRYNAPTPYDSIDERDMKTVLTTPGGLAFVSLTDIKEKDLDGCSIEDLLIEKIKKSAHVELQRDGVIGCTALITNLDPKLNETFDSHILKVREFIGEPTEEFLHIAVNGEKTLPNSVFLILAGLSPCTDRVEKIRERVDEILMKRSDADAEKQSEEVVSADEIQALNMHRSQRTGTNIAEGTEVTLSDTFAKFGV